MLDRKTLEHLTWHELAQIALNLDFVLRQAAETAIHRMTGDENVDPEFGDEADADADADAERPQYQTVVGYAKSIGQTLGLDEAKELGRKASEFSRERGLPMAKVADERWTEVNGYCLTALLYAFANR